MKTLIPAAIRCSLIFTAVTALSIVYPASVRAVPTTYQYTGPFFTDVFGVYTTSDFVTGMVTFAGPLAPNMPPFTGVSAIAFRFSDGVQTLTSLTAQGSFGFATDATGAITDWDVALFADTGGGLIGTTLSTELEFAQDEGFLGDSFGQTFSEGEWTRGVPAPDTGSTLSLMTLSLVALGPVARRFQRGSGLIAPGAGRSRSHDAMIRVYDNRS